MKLNKKQIPFYAAFVQTAQYALAGFFLIGHLGWFFVGSMGALVSLATAYGTSQFSDIAQKRKPAALVALVVLMALSPIVVGTATWLHLTQITNPIWRGVVSAAWGMLPDMAVALSGFIAGKGLVEQSEKPHKQTKQTKSGQKKIGEQSSSGKSSVKATGKQTTRAEKMKEQIPCRWGCGLVGSKGQMNGHSAHCEKNPAKQFEQAAKVGKQ
jgi:hypothetical protein